MIQGINNSTISLETIRKFFPITKKKIYLYNGNMIPCSIPVYGAMEKFLKKWQVEGDSCWNIGYKDFSKAKNLFGKLINAPAETIVGIGNTTTGINMAALLISPKPGQNVVVTDLEHMSNVYPWYRFKHNGVNIRMVPSKNGTIDLEEFANYVDDQTAAVSICHVTMGTGFRWDISEVCNIAHSHGAHVVIDAAQSVGAVPVDVTNWGVDFLAAPTFKWLLGPLGAGFLYVHPDIIKKCDPPLPGWFGVKNPLDNDLHSPKWYDTAHKYERGVPSMISFAGASAGLSMLEKIGFQVVFDRIAGLSAYLYKGLSDLDVQIITPEDTTKHAGIIAIKIDRQDILWEQLETENIHIGNWLECLRIDPGCYNTYEELDKLLMRIRKFITK